MVLADYRGLTVAEDTALRSELRKNDIASVGCQKLAFKLLHRLSWAKSLLNFTYRLDKAANVHARIGKASFPVEKLVENYLTLVDTLIKVKPAAQLP